MRRWIGLALAVLSLISPAASALFRLEATLQPDQPLVLDGVVSTGVDAKNINGVLSWPSPTNTSPNQGNERELLRADHAGFVVLRWAWPTAATPYSSVAGQERPFSVDHASLRLSSLLDKPQVGFSANSQLGATGSLNATTPHCLISHAQTTDSFVFPDDPNQPFFAPDHVGARADQLAVDCQAMTFQAEGPSRVQFYGMLVHVVGDNKDETIRTGTFEEALVDVEGLPATQKVTQILVAKEEGARIRFETGEAHVRFFAAPLLAVGRLSSGDAEGELAWGPLRQDGAVEPFSATGEYRLDAAENNHVSVDGQTIEGPAVQAPPNAAASSAAILLGAAIIGGVVLLAAAARLLWPLFTRLEPESVLAHPRRERILAYVREHPGVHMADVARTLELRWTKVHYHVSKLSTSGHLRVHRVGGRTALFPTKMGYAGRETLVAILLRPRVREVWNLLQARPGISQAEIARELGVHRSQVTRAMQLLSRAGHKAAARPLA